MKFIKERNENMKKIPTLMIISLVLSSVCAKSIMALVAIAVLTVPGAVFAQNKAVYRGVSISSRTENWEVPNKALRCVASIDMLLLR